MTPPLFDRATTFSYSARVTAHTGNYREASQPIESCRPTFAISLTKYLKKSKSYTRNESPSCHQYLNKYAPNRCRAQHNTHNTTQHNTIQPKTNQQTTTLNITPSTSAQASMLVQCGISKKEVHMSHSSHTAWTPFRRKH